MTFSYLRIDIIGLDHQIVKLSDFGEKKIYLKHGINHALKIEVCNAALMNLLDFVCLSPLTPFNSNST